MSEIEPGAYDHFPRSWIDRLIDWIDRLPGPAWLFYVSGILATALLINVILWIDGSVPYAAAGSIQGIFPPFVFYFLALYHYLTRIGSSSLRSFRPLLGQDEAGISRIEHHLSRLPRWLGILAIPLGLLSSPPYILGDRLVYGDLFPQTALPYVVATAIAGFTGATFMCVVIRSIRQLLMVNRLHAQAADISLLDLEPAHAFSALTARAGIGVFLIIVFGYFYEPTMIDSALILLFYLAVALVAALVFVVPILGMRDRLDQEKKRALRETGDLLQITRNRLHDRVRNENYLDIGDTKDAIEALIRERELLDKISTWPWDPGTIRGFASTLLLPIVLWLVTRLLERVL